MSVKSFVILFAILLSILNTLYAQSQKQYPSIQFLGAAQMVGGSSFLVDTGKTKFLVDCGLFYGLEHEKLNSKFLFDPSQISFILLTHAHIDHMGRIPMLYKYGFKGPVVGTDATKSISGIMLNMSMNIAKDNNKSLFSWDDYSATMQNFRIVAYSQTVKLSDDVYVRYLDAGHIMGSAIIEIVIKTNSKDVKLVVASDLGHSNTPILKDPAIIQDADYVLIESTYGIAVKKQSSQFGKNINDTIKNGGSVLIPAFVLEKTQKIIYTIGQLKMNGIIDVSTPVYSDSSTAHEISSIYRKYSKYYDTEALNLETPLNFSGLYEVDSKKSLQAHALNKPAIYISSSGMLDHGNAPKHLEKMIDNPKNMLAIVGWQAPDSLGRRLLDGYKTVNIPIENFNNGKVETKTVTKSVKMKVKKFDEFSSHADGCELLTWLGNIRSNKEVIIIHGELNSEKNLADKIQSNLGLKTFIPALNDVRYLNPKATSYSVSTNSRPCYGLDIINSNNQGSESDQ